MNNNIDHTRFVSGNNWNWRSRSQRTYPVRLDFTIENEKYCVDTNKVIPTKRTIHIVASYYLPHKLDLHYSDHYSPHILLLEGEEDTLIDPSNGIGNNSDIRTYHRIKKQIRLIGDIPFEFNKRTLPRIRNSYPRSAYILDKLNQSWKRPRKLTLQEIRTQTLQEDEYYLKREDYEEVVKDLNRNQGPVICTTSLVIRPIKKVYFSHEVRYFPKDRKIPTSEILPPVKEFTFVGDPLNNTIIIGEAIRGPRRTQLTQPPFQSILKVRTRYTKTNTFWETKLERHGKDYKYYKDISPTIRSNLFHELKTDQSEHFIDWFKQTEFIAKTPDEILKRYLYYINRKFRHDLIDEAIITRVKNRLAANKILNTWRVQVNKRIRV